MSEPTVTPAMQAFLDAAKKAADLQSLATDGFARAFMDATGLRPEDAEMMVEIIEVKDHVGGAGVLKQRVWFQRRAM